MEQSRASARRGGGRVSTIVLVGAMMVMASGIGASAQSAGGCLMTGSVGFAPGLTVLPQTGTFSFNANLSSCQSNPAGPSAGTVSLGRIWTDAAGHQWQEPQGTLNGGCGSTTTEGVSIIRWADGTTTVAEVFNVSGAGQIVLTGEAIPSVTLTAVNRADGQAETLTVATTRYATGRITGQINVIGPMNALLLCGTTGLTSVSIYGGSTLAEA